VTGVRTQMGLVFEGDTVVLTAGTFLSGLIHIGLQNYTAGRAGDPDDGRQVIVTLTAAGRQVLRETRRAREGWMAKRFSDLSDDEIETLARATTILERIAAS